MKEFPTKVTPRNFTASSSAEHSSRDVTKRRSEQDPAEPANPILSTARSSVDVAEFATKKAKDLFQDTKLLSAGQKTSSLRAAERSWRMYVPYVFAAQPVGKNTKNFMLSDTTEIAEKYHKWFAAKWLGFGEAPKARFDDSSVFYVAPASDAPLLRLGTISEMEESGLGCEVAIHFIDPKMWLGAEDAEESKALLFILSTNGFFASRDDFDSKLFLNGMDEASFKSAALRALVLAAGDPTDDGHFTLIKNLIEFGLDPHEYEPSLEISAYEMAKKNGNHSFVAIFDSIKK